MEEQNDLYEKYRQLGVEEGRKITLAEVRLKMHEITFSGGSILEDYKELTHYLMSL